MLRIFFNFFLCQLRLEREGELMFQGFALLSVKNQESVYQSILHIVSYLPLVNLHIFSITHMILINKQSEIDFFYVSSGAYSKINSSLCIFMIFLCLLLIHFLNNSTQGFFYAKAM